jgi:hypothetical protein
VKDLVFITQPRTVLHASKEASALKFFMELMVFHGRGLFSDNGQVTALMARV